MPAMFVTEEMFQLERSPLKRMAPPNIVCMFVTDEVSQEDKSPLKTIILELEKLEKIVTSFLPLGIPEWETEKRSEGHNEKIHNLYIIN